MIENIPYELSIQILSYLQVKDLANCCKVSLVWKEFARENMLWKKVAVGLNIPNGMRIKDYIDSCDTRHVITSLYFLKMRSQEFVKTKDFNQLAFFTCQFPSYSHTFLNCKLQLTTTLSSRFFSNQQQPLLDGEPNLKEFFIFDGDLTHFCKVVPVGSYDAFLDYEEPYNFLTKCTSFSCSQVSWSYENEGYNEMESLILDLNYSVPMTGLYRLKAEARSYHKNNYCLTKLVRKICEIVAIYRVFM